MIDSDGKIRKYDTPDQILEEFFHLRLAFYEKRKKALVANLDLELKKLNNRLRFIKLVVEGKLEVRGRKKAQLFQELQHLGFDPFPKRKVGADPQAVGAIDDEEGTEESHDDPTEIIGSEYDYLLSMSIGTLTLEKMEDLIDEMKKCEVAVEEMRNTPPTSLWYRDLDALEKELDLLDEMDAKDEEDRRLKREKDAKKKGAQKQPKKREPKKTVAKPEKDESANTDTEGNAAEPAVTKRAAPRKKQAKANVAGSDHDQENAKPAPQRKKQSKKASTPVTDDEEDDGPSLKDRVAALNIDDSSLDNSAMDVEPTGQQNRGRKGATIISSDDEDVNEDDDFAIDEVQTQKK